MSTEDLPAITEAVLAQWEASAKVDLDMGEIWSVHPSAILAVVAKVRQLTAERDAAVRVATTTMRDTLTEQIFDDGKPIGSLAELAGVTVTDEMANFRIQYGIADVLRKRA